VTAGGLVFASTIQLGTFLAPLVVARAGLISGEIAGLVAIVGWFVVGLPLSIAAVETLAQRRALQASRERDRLTSVPARTAVLHSR
jgi:hypothetical protein